MLAEEQEAVDMLCLQECRGHGSGPAPPFGALGNKGTGFDYSKQNNFTKNSCGQSGWPVTPLLGK